MASGTPCEPEIVTMDLSERANKTYKKEKFLCLNDTDKFKRNWSKEYCVKLSTRSAQPRKKSWKHSGMCTLVESVSTCHWDTGKSLSQH